MSSTGRQPQVLERPPCWEAGCPRPSLRRPPGWLAKDWETARPSGPATPLAVRTRRDGDGDPDSGSGSFDLRQKEQLCPYPPRDCTRNPQTLLRVLRNLPLRPECLYLGIVDASHQPFSVVGGCTGQVGRGQCPWRAGSTPDCGHITILVVSLPFLPAHKLCIPVAHLPANASFRTRHGLLHFLPLTRPGRVSSAQIQKTHISV